MAKKIVGVLRPFGLEQDFYVFEDGEKIDSAYLTIDEINEKLIEFIEKYDVKQIDLSGPKTYSKGIANNFRKAELVQYNKNEIEINLI